jgi:hypothetical protein
MWCNHYTKITVQKSSDLENLDDGVRRAKGIYIQDCFNYLTKDERELIISNTCPICFSNTFDEEAPQKAIPELTEADKELIRGVAKIVKHKHDFDMNMIQLLNFDLDDAILNQLYEEAHNAVQ